MNPTFELGFIGAGNMAEAMARGAIRTAIAPAASIIASDPNPSRRQLFESLGMRVSERNEAIVRGARVVVLATKPQMWRAALQDCASAFDGEQLVITIMAGVSTASIESALPGPAPRIVRAMPNLPMQLGAGMAGLCGGKHARAEDVAYAKRLFDAGGATVVLNDENLLHAVTAVSGSGPAYFYLFTEALIKAGKIAGLSADDADRLAKQTCLGAARMMLETVDPPATLRERVTSPNGTTFAALESLRKDGVFDEIVEAVLAADRRSRELGA